MEEFLVFVLRCVGALLFDVLPAVSPSESYDEAGGCAWWLAAIAAGALIGWGSCLPFPQLLMSTANGRLALLFLGPALAGAGCWLGMWAFAGGPGPGPPARYAWTAVVFVFAFEATRFVCCAR